MRILAALALLLPMEAALAHPLAPALLELQEVAPARYAVLWRTSVSRAGPAIVAPRLPAGCMAVSEPRPRIEDGEALVSRWLVQCAAGLDGAVLAVDGLAGSGINVIARVVARDGAEAKALLGADQPSFTVLPAKAAVFGPYFALGVSHLFRGYDHLLFLLGLVLLVRGWRALALTVTAFTLGHSLTLALAALGRIPPMAGAAELAIAGTLLVLALDLARPAGSPPTLLRRRPWLAAGGFGLVHGLGFAATLAGIGLPAAAIPLSLLAFNLGIEAAQLAVVAALLAAGALLAKAPARAAAAAAQLPACVIGSLAVCWCLERSAGLLG